MERGINRFIKVYPWYMGLSGDLLFYVAIGQLFFTVVRNFTTAEIVSITTFGTIAAIITYFPILWLIKRIKRTTAARLSGLFIFLAALCHTFGSTVYVVVVGQVFLNASASFRQVVFVSLENNLKLIDKKHDFLKIRTAGNTVYAVLTMLISFVASLMFNFNNYLPMICCVIAAFLGFITSFFMVDYSENGTKQAREQVVKVNYTKTVVITMISYGLFFAAVTSGQANQQLFIQENLFLHFDVEQTALILGVVLACSRIIRVISNIIFIKLYRYMKKKTGNLLAFMLLLSFILSVVGSFVPIVAVKIILMALGYVVILLIRDPFNLFIQDILFEYTPNDQHATLITNLRFTIKIATLFISTMASLILLKFPLVYVIVAIGIFAAVETVISLKMYRMIKSAKSVEAE